MGMRDNWKLFVETAKAKADSHMKVAQHWDNVHHILSIVLIVLSAITTVLALLEKLVPIMATAGVSGLTTLLSAVSGFLQPSKRRQRQLESSKEFRSLMIRMIRCEADREYEELWNEYNKTLISEPFLPKRHVIATPLDYSMTEEMTVLIARKENGIFDDEEKTISRKDSVDSKENY